MPAEAAQQSAISVDRRLWRGVEKADKQLSRFVVTNEEVYYDLSENIHQPKVRSLSKALRE